MYSYKNIKFWNPTKLWKLRKEICLNSIYYDDYKNSFGIDKYLVCDFFDGFLEYCEIELKEKTGKKYIPIESIFNMDTKENLWNWFCCFDRCPFSDNI